MNATIYHNPRCGTSRATLRLLEEAGVDLDVVEYMTTPLARGDLAALYRRAGVNPRDALRPDAPAAAKADDEAALDAMTADPALIQRPIVATAKGVVIARPPERVRDVL